MTNTKTDIVVKVLGIGGCGCNNVWRVIRDDDPIAHFSLMAANTDGQNLDVLFGVDNERVKLWASQFTALKLGDGTAKQLGGGGDPEVGARETEKSADEIEAFVKDADILLIVSGLGKATGSGGTPVVARIAKDLGVATIAVCTQPLMSEGARRAEKADLAKAQILSAVPTILIHNDAVNQVLQEEDDKLPSWVWDHINKISVVSIIRHLREISQVMGNVTNSDVADLRTALTFGNELWFNTWHVPNGKVTEDDIKSNLLTNRFLDSKILESSSAISTWLHGKWGFLVTEKVQGQINAICRDRKPETFWGQYESEEDRHVSLLAVANTTASADVVDQKRIQRFKPGSVKSMKCSVDGRPTTLVLPVELVDEWEAEIRKQPANITRLKELQATMAEEEAQHRMPDIPQRIVQAL